MGRLLFAFVLLLSLAGTTHGIVYFDDGGTHDIDYVINDTVWVDSLLPGRGTTVNLLDGGTVDSGYYLHSWEDSAVNVQGGYIHDLNTRDRSTLNVSGGLIMNCEAFDNSLITVTNGSVYSLKSSSSESSISVSGGLLTQASAQQGGNVTISGGLQSDRFFCFADGTITVEGYGFAIDGNPVGFGELGTILGGDWNDEPARRLTGALISSEPIDLDLYIGNTGRIVLIPEPVVLSLLIMGGLVMLRRRRKMG